jgi:hypothetical protein
VVVSGEDDGRLDELQNIDGKLTEKYFYFFTIEVFSLNEQVKKNTN